MFEMYKLSFSLISRTEVKSTASASSPYSIPTNVYLANESSVNGRGGLSDCVVEDSLMEEEPVSKEITPTRVKSIEGHSKKVFSCKWNPCSDVLATGYLVWTASYHI